MSSKISVIIPVYNAESTIGNILEKLTTQEYDNIEVVAVNDGSKDDSLKVLGRYARKDKRVVVVDKKNGGAGAARNTGLESATGDFVTFIDSDDIIDSNLIVELASRIADNIDFVVCGMQLNGQDITAPNEVIFGSNNIAQYVLKSLLTRNLLYGPCCKLFRRELIVKNHIAFPVDIKYGEDTIFVLQYLGVTQGIAVVGKALYFYEMSPSGLASKNDTIRSYRQARTVSLNEYMAGKWSFSNCILYGILRARWAAAFIKRRLA